MGMKTLSTYIFTAVNRTVILLAGLLIINFSGSGQESREDKRSEIVEVIDGAKYYIHFVKEGETLTLISGIYEVAPSEILSKNPGLTEILKTGQIIKIPFTARGKKPEDNLMIYDREVIYHIVKKQESLFGIAKKYNVKITDIQSLNPGLAEQINEGQLLKIPRNEPADKPEIEQAFTLHEVRQSETLYSISKLYGLTTGDIKDFNPGLTDTIRTGQIIKIPGEENFTSESKKPAVTIKNYTVHKVSSGETLYSIARQYGVNIDSVYAYNTGLSSGIYPGQEIRIPLRRNPVDYISHTVRSGEKLQTISEKYNVSKKDIKNENPDKGNKYVEGETIRIPVDKGSLITQKPDTIREVIEKPQAEVMVEAEDPSKKVYNVALLVPFSLEVMDSLNPTDIDYFDKLSRLKSFRFIQFYEGFLIAADSLEKQGFRLNLFVYDVDNDPEKVDAIRKSSEIKRMDLIIGPFFNKSFTPIAELAKNYEISIVNPLSERDEVVKGNPFVFKIKPSPESQAVYAARYIAENYNQSNVLVIRANSLSFKNTATQIDLVLREKNFISTGSDPQKMLTDINYNIEHFQGVLNNLKKGTRNVIIIPTDDKVFSLDVVSKLNQLHRTYNILLFGLPDWSEFTDIETQHLHNLDFHTVVAGYTDYDDPKIIELVKKFRSKYKTEPQEVKYAFDGFDIGWYFMNALMQFNKNFPDRIEKINQGLTQGSYFFERSGEDGYLNNHWIIVKYNNYKVVKAR